MFLSTYRASLSPLYIKIWMREDFMCILLRMDKWKWEKWGRYSMGTFLVLRTILTPDPSIHFLIYHWKGASFCSSQSAIQTTIISYFLKRNSIYILLSELKKGDEPSLWWDALKVIKLDTWFDSSIKFRSIFNFPTKSKF